MSSLHLIQAQLSPTKLSILFNIQNEDTILLMQDGVYYVNNNMFITNIINNINIYVLEEDLLVRGLNNNIINNKIININYNKFVALTTKYSKIISWY